MAVWQTGARLPDWLDWENESGTNLAGGQSGKLPLPQTGQLSSLASLAKNTICASGVQWNDASIDPICP